VPDESIAAFEWSRREVIQRSLAAGVLSRGDTDGTDSPNATPESTSEFQRLLPDPLAERLRRSVELRAKIPKRESDPEVVLLTLLDFALRADIGNRIEEAEHSETRRAVVASSPGTRAIEFFESRADSTDSEFDENEFGLHNASLADVVESPEKPHGSRPRSGYRMCPWAGIDTLEDYWSHSLTAPPPETIAGELELSESVTELNLGLTTDPAKRRRATLAFDQLFAELSDSLASLPIPDSARITEEGNLAAVVLPRLRRADRLQRSTASHLLSDERISTIEEYYASSSQTGTDDSDEFELAVVVDTPRLDVRCSPRRLAPSAELGTIAESVDLHHRYKQLRGNSLNPFDSVVEEGPEVTYREGGGQN
jgi:hypothetical protein